MTLQPESPANHKIEALASDPPLDNQPIRFNKGGRLSGVHTLHVRSSKQVGSATTKF